MSSRRVSRGGEPTDATTTRNTKFVLALVQFSVRTIRDIHPKAFHEVIVIVYIYTRHSTIAHSNKPNTYGDDDPSDTLLTNTLNRCYISRSSSPSFRGGPHYVPRRPLCTST